MKGKKCHPSSREEALEDWLGRCMMGEGSWIKRKSRILSAVILFTFVSFAISGCAKKDEDVDDVGGTVSTEDYVVLAWNDLGMHCLNPTYDQLIILPPYNTLWAQVIERGNPPRVVTTGMEVTYAVIHNTTSSNKLSYGQFWNSEVLALFNAAGLAKDTGLNLRDPNVHNGLSGTMHMDGDHFQADGIPVTPVEDGTTVKEPYQVAEITVKDWTGSIIAQTRATIPTSDEINCGRCHAPGGTTSQVFAYILQAHDASNSTTLEKDAPILCASCHGSPVLGSAPGDRGSSGLYLSEAVHGFHVGRTPPGGGTPIACYDCHPGKITQCSRSIAHTSSDGNCVACHGTMADVATGITNGDRIPWEDEPRCATCHTGVAEVDTGTTLYRNATGHGGLYCAACHQSPHAMVPSQEASDNYQAQQYQGVSVTIASCAACHSSSKPENGNLSEFREEHAGIFAEKDSACAVCHTALPSDIRAEEFPHHFEWRNR